MKIMLVNAPWQRGRHWGVRAGSRWPHIRGPHERDYLPFPFYLAYAASLLRREEFDTRLVDAIAEQVPEEAFVEQVEKEHPDLVVFETSTPSLAHDLSLIQRFPKELPVLLCGPDVNIRDPEFLKDYPQVRFVLQGEYEVPLLELARRLRKSSPLSGVPGLIWRQNGDIRINPKTSALPDLDQFPWPWRDPLPMMAYNDAPGGIPRPSVQMISSRGCPYNCGFCVWPQVMYGGRNYRMRSIKDVADEMEFLVSHYGFKSIYFDDDTFNISRSRTLEFAREVKRRRKEGRINVPWAIMARADLMTEEILGELRAAGLEAAKYGVESSSQELLNAIDKGMDFKENDRMIRFTQSLGIKAHLTFTFGLPGETKETIQRTIDYALDVSPSTVQFSITTPFPGTWYFKELERAGLLDSTDWSKYDGNNTSVIRTSGLSPRELEQAERDAYSRWRIHCWQRTTDRAGIMNRHIWDRTVRSLREEGIRPTLSKSLDYARWCING